MSRYFRGRVRRRRFELGVAAILSTSALALSAIVGVVPTGAVDMGAADGTLTRVDISPTLNCSAVRQGDISDEFFPGDDGGNTNGDSACGTFVTDGTNVYGPASVNAGMTLTDSDHYIPWTPVSQTVPTGSGTATDPYKIITVVAGGPFTVTETDTYQTNQEAYRTDIQVQSSSSVHAVIYHAGDCYLQESDIGRGQLSAGNAPTCTATQNSPDANRILELYPLSPASRHFVGFFDDMWARLATMAPLPDTIVANDPDNTIGSRSGYGPSTADTGYSYDNAMALSWAANLSAGGSSTFSALTVFSPNGVQPLSVTSTPSNPSPQQGDQFDYTLTISNPSSTQVPIQSIVDTLPAGLTYVPGSSHGLTSANPTVHGQELTWTGPFTLPSASGAQASQSTLTFSVRVTGDPGTYRNRVSLIGVQGATVLPFVDSNPVTVHARPTTTAAHRPVATTPRSAPSGSTAGAARPVSAKPTFTG